MHRGPTGQPCLRAGTCRMNDAPVMGKPDGQAQTGRGDCTDGPTGSGMSAHILPTSATMIGVCLTALYISLLGPTSAHRLVVDKLLAVDTLVFLASAMLSFVSMRTRAHGVRNETRAEAIFIAGLSLLALVALWLAFAIT